MGNATRKYIQTYMPDSDKQQDIRFLPMEDVDGNHVVRRKALDFQKAQDVIYGACSSQSLDGMSYEELVQHSARRILAC
jgi:hypothetical protein